MMRIQALSYIVAETTDISRWKDFGENVVGAPTAPAGDGGLLLKLDERAYRIAVQPGKEDRYFASGWEAVNEQAFRDTVAALEKAGGKPEAGSEALRKARNFRELVSFTDPSGNRHELVWGYTGPTAPFISPIGVSGFKTGIYGMGHTVLPALNFDATLDFFRNVFGFGLSDVFNFQPGPDAPRMRIYFLHAASGRHHSLALAEMPAPSGCVHMMLEVNSMTEVGLANDRMLKKNIKNMATLGQHENDRMTSFYMLTPGNFAMEYGWGGLIVDPSTHKTTETQQVSIWGHDFSVGFR
jgi:3,4-dihydroxy-9,10-secoandrosta-1,3,5(10)-triene-9,17-dione 4,5-dioxygenase